MITNEEARKVLDNYTSLKRRCSTIVCSLVDNCPKVVEVTDLVKSPCGGGYISSDAQIWETEECLLVRYLCEYPIRQCSLDNWKYFYVPLRWVQTDKTATAGIAEYKEKTADARAKWEVENLDRQIKEREQELTILRNKRARMET